MFKTRDEIDDAVVEALIADPHFFPPDKIRPKFVLDLGCWTGFTTTCFARRWPRATILACDADRDNVKQARVNCRGMKKVTVVEAAIAEPGQHQLSCDAKNRRSLFGDGRDKQMVEGVTVDQLLGDYKGPIDFVKMDIEGMEQHAFQGEWVARTDRVLVELHPDVSIHNLLMAHGFDVLPIPPSSGAPNGLYYATRP